MTHKRHLRTVCLMLVIGLVRSNGMCLAGAFISVISGGGRGRSANLWFGQFL
jgi:hypothetical protein